MAQKMKRGYPKETWKSVEPVEENTPK